MSKVHEVELDLYKMKTNKLNIPNFKSISQTCQKTAEKTPENYSCKSRSSVTKLELDLYQVKPTSYTKFQANISKDCRENSGNLKGNNSCKSKSSVTKLELDLYYVIHDKFIYQTSSQYLKRLQRKVWKTEVRWTDGQTARKLFFNNKSVSGKPIWD